MSENDRGVDWGEGGDGKRGLSPNARNGGLHPNTKKKIFWLVTPVIFGVALFSLWKFHLFSYSENFLEEAYRHNLKIREQILQSVPIAKVWSNREVLQVCIVHFASDYSKLSEQVRHIKTLDLPFWKPVGDEAFSMLVEFRDGGSDYIVVKLSDALFYTQSASTLCVEPRRIKVEGTGSLLRIDIVD